VQEDRARIERAFDGLQPSAFPEDRSRERATGIEPAWSCLEDSGLTSWLHPHSDAEEGDLYTHTAGLAHRPPAARSCDRSRLAWSRAPDRHRTGNLSHTKRAFFS